MLKDLQRTSTSDTYGAKYIPLEFWEAIKVCFYKYTDFNGRASRSECWWFALFTTLSAYFVAVFDYAIAYDYYNSYWEYLRFGEMGIIEIIHFILFFLPSFAVSIRRLHDVNRSGWNILWSLTIIGIIPVIYWHIQAGGDEKNIYGNNPLKKRKTNKSPKSQQSNTKNIEKTNEVKVEDDKPKDVKKSKAKKETLAADADQISDELQKYKQMLKDGLISQTDYNAKKKQILGI